MSLSSMMKMNSIINTSINSAEEDANWQQIVENHHELCDLDKCCGKQINGLYACQYANIPGHQYSQYLRHRRRQSAYKTKPCRNHFSGNGYCHVGDLCPFFHSAEEKREPPPSEFLVDGGSNISGSTNNLNNTMANFPPIGYFGGRKQQQPSLSDFYYQQQYQQQQREEEQYKHALLDKLIYDAQSIELKMSKYLMANRENFPPEETFNFYQRQPYQVPRNNSMSTSADFHFQQQQYFSDNDEKSRFPAADYRRFSTTDYRSRQFLGMGASHFNNQQNQKQQQLAYKSQQSSFNFNPFGGFGGGFSRAVGGDICSSQAAQLRSAATKGMGMTMKKNNGNNNTSMMMTMMGMAGCDFSKSFHPFSESYPLKNLLPPNVVSCGDHRDNNIDDHNTETVDSCGYGPPSCGSSTITGYTFMSNGNNH